MRVQTEAGAILGTPGYIAPEQLEGREVDARSDQFSFCVALYEAIYQQLPFAGDSFADYAGPPDSSERLRSLGEA
ncbi:hypothetical protein BVG81_005700 [Haliangium sp. UPWRP_2]|nr:hypothetical protein BVG81_005700 [Haliangium sp. UPWRP_2]